MGGTLRGSIEHFFPTANITTYRDCFVAICKFLIAHPAWTGVASQGNGATGAPSTWTYSSGANAPGENSFAVFRNTGGSYRYTILVQFCYAVAFGTAPGNPGNLRFNQPGVGIAMAYDTSGGTAVWGGGTGNISADSKSSPVWVTAGGNLVVHPRGNGLNGTYATNKEACALISSGAIATANNRFHIIGDDDFIFTAFDDVNDANYACCMYIGPYAAATGVVLTGPPLVMISSPGSINNNTAIGSIDNTIANGEGGIADYTGANRSRILKVMLDANRLATNFQPNAQRSPSTYDLYNLPLVLDDTNTTTTRGLIGYIELVKVGWNIPVQDTNVALTQMFVGNATVDFNLAMGWDGVTVPGSGATVAGVQF